jgi:hypothetical protein
MLISKSSPLLGCPKGHLDGFPVSGSYFKMAGASCQFAFRRIVI